MGENTIGSPKISANKSKAKPKKSKEPKDTCFTIMPYGDWFDDYYETIFCPAIRDSGLKPTRADDLFRPGTIVNDIWTFTNQAKVVLADLTGKNPNVFYELGLAHALAKPVVLVTESIENVPFDLRPLRVLEYDKNEPRWAEALEENITRAIKEVLVSPTEAVLPTFLQVKKDGKTKQVSESEKTLLELRQEVDIIKQELLNPKRNFPRRVSSPEQAKEIIRDYVRAYAPTSYIVRKLSERGVPEDWTMRQIDESRMSLRKKKR